ncbi:MAG: AAA family ATPase [bacterium]|nr:AAA family ATPase [bacterium]
MRIIAFANQKGGVGKSTSAVNIGAGLVRLGKRVLWIDLDPQAHLTYSLGVKAHELSSSIYDLLRGRMTWQEVAIVRGGEEGLGKIIPATLDLAGAEIELAGMPGRELLLREALEGVRGFDYLLIDCPPNLGLLTVNALAAAKEVFIPLQAEYLALQGVSKLVETVDIVKKRLNKKLTITGVIATRYDTRKTLNREVVETIRGYFGDKVFQTMIRDNIAVAEAPSYGKSIFEYAPQSKGAADYTALCKEIEGRDTK